MTLYSSREPFNADPTPWVSEVTGSRYSKPAKYGHTRWTFYPRPEYDRPQHNPTNQILVEFRKLHEETGNDLWTDAYLAWSDMIEEEWGTRDEYWHAFSVLGKIVASKKDES